LKKRIFYNFKILFLALLSVFVSLVLDAFFVHRAPLRKDLSYGAVTTLRKSTMDLLSRLSSPVKITYYASERKRMPTSMRRLERDIRALLSEMKRCGNGNFTYEVIYPEDRPQVARGLGRFRISSFQFKTIMKDEYSVTTVWSGMLVEYMGKTRSIPYITGSHLQHLENRIMTHLCQIETGYKPVIAVCAPAHGYDDFRKTIVDWDLGDIKAELRDFTFGKDMGIPVDADAAFIIQPDNLSEEDVRSMRDFLEDGKDIFLSFSPYSAETGGGAVRFAGARSGLEGYLSDMGVEFERGALLEENNYRGSPLLMYVLSRQVIRDDFSLPACGTMLFPYASPIRVDLTKLKKAGYACKTLVFSSEKSWTIPVSENGGVFSLAQFKPPSAENRRVQNMGVLIASDKAWEGRLFVYSSGHIFSDSANYDSDYPGANRLYLKNLLMTFASPHKLTSIRLSRERKPSLPYLSAPVRFLLRVITVFLVPMMGFLFLVTKVVRVRLFKGMALRPGMGLMVSFAAGGAVFLFLFLAGFTRNMALDMTKDRVNGLSPATLKWIHGIKDKVNIRYITSPSSEMPLSAKSMTEDVTCKLRDIASSSRRHIAVSVEVVREEKIPEWVRQSGVTPFRMKLIENDRYVDKMVYSGLVFETEGRRETVPHLTCQNVDRLEFIVVSSLCRLLSGIRPTIAFLADLPHITPAEFWELEQLHVKIIPKSEDVYGDLLDILRNEGYEVNIYDSSTGQELREDLVIYLQPWVVTDHMKKEMGKALSSGRSVLVAAQHYHMQSRKYPGGAYGMVYWPQPQFSRVNELLRPYGIELVKEIFFDQSKAAIESSERIYWGAYRKESMSSPDAQPFIIRAVPLGFDRSSPVTSHLSDILFIWGNRWRCLDKAKFDGKRLSWRTLVSSTEDCWSYGWESGWIPEKVLGGGDYLDVKQPLAVMIRGFFSDASSAESSLFLIGSSAMFTNAYIDLIGYAHEKFILNAVADLTYPHELAVIQARGERTASGFGYVPPEKKLFFRGMTIFFFPAILCLYGLYRRRRIYSDGIANFKVGGRRGGHERRS